MIRSMTGYGKAVLETPHKKITVEVKSLNSKQSDVSAKMPWIYKEKEMEIRNMVSRKLERGKIDIFISFDTMEDETIPVINRRAVMNYYNQLRELANELGADRNTDLLSIVMRLPETLKAEKAELTGEEWNVVSQLIDEALSMVDLYRLEEGKALESDLLKSVNRITGYLDNIRDVEGDRIAKMREKLTTLLSDAVGSENVDKNRFEQELIFYLEKLDINEEKVRLQKHCDYFLETMKGAESNGKMLSFISQEMGREINTIGSKANDAAMQKLVVMMKDELERIKEQTLNIL
ncbi:MAG TPA: YicC/YloC family endoribonuclease [Bacteroidales bacterium]|nr:YicC/YloC family endoribonuclease [Bacteroidales bacterium]